ncbi:MAG: MFS transporter [Candidatus Aenigmarchaeota archaeon]|nr:MFS transporter [Candidatus Aenigmarchaeota archaeon]
MKTFSALRDGFSPLKIRDFRVYMSGQLVSLVGTWMQLMALSWVVWDLSHSMISLGIAGMLASLPILILGPVAGVTADKSDRRKLLLVTQAGSMMTSLVIAFLVYRGSVQIWHLYSLSVLLGIFTAFDLPAQQAFIGDLSGMSEVRKAVVVNAMIIQVSRLLGPALAGLIIGSVGAATAFLLNGMSFLAVIASLLAVKANQVRKETAGVNDFRDSIKFMKKEPRIQDLVLFTALVTIFAMSIMSVLPAIATDVLGGNAGTLGFLMAASGAGALLSTIAVIPMVQQVKRTGFAVGLSVIWTGAWFIAFSLSRSIAISMASLFLMSAGIPIVLTTSIGLVQTMSPPDMKARLLSMLIMVSFGLQPFAAFGVGLMGQIFGPAGAIRANGSALVIGASLMLLLRKGLISWEAPAPK